MQDLDVPEEETLRALDDLVRAGKVLYLGCSNYAAYRLMESLWISDKRNLERFVSQPGAVLAPRARAGARARGHRHQVRRGHPAVVAARRGMLSGKYKPGAPAPDGTRMTSKRFEGRLAKLNEPRSQRVLEALEGLSAETGRSVLPGGPRLGGAEAGRQRR
jgi:aryl-alcohol dehydrogenase-like predicted oxidoreductase